jgi:hypothetical protein
VLASRSFGFAQDDSSHSASRAKIQGPKCKIQLAPPLYDCHKTRSHRLGWDS